MVWLNASLAFALAMIIFCTMVTAITEAIHHVFRMRRSGLEQMLGQFFEHVVWPRVAPTVTQLTDKTKDQIKTDFIQTLTRNPAVEQTDGRVLSLRTWFAPRTLASLTLAQFAERLADTELGQHLWSSGRDYATQVVDGVARRFNYFEDGATAYFAERAQMMSLLVAILLAFALNVDAIRLFSAFLSNQELTARVLASADAIIAPLQTPAAPTPSTAALVAPAPAGALETPQPPPPTATVSPTPVTAAPQASSAGQGTTDDKDLQALKDKAAFLNAQIRTSTALGLPIGTAYFPWCRGTLAEPSCTPRTLPRVLGWLCSVFLAGVLIGLGGPFWFNAFSSLSAFIRLLGSSGKGSKVEDASATQKPSIQPPQPKTAGEAFAAAAGAAAPQLGQGRILLTPDGTPL